jgi:predicted small lipoprotein YifL
MVKKLLFFFLLLSMLAGCSSTEDTSLPDTEDQAPVDTEEEIDQNQQKDSPPPIHSASTTPYESSKITIKDESNLDASLEAFLSKLQKAVAEQDTETLLSLIAHNIKYSFGGIDDKDEFISFWKLDQNPKQSEIWEELEDALALGGSFFDPNHNTYIIPYIYTYFPQEVDPYEYSAIIGQNVNIRATPDIQGEVITKMSLETVRNDGPPSDQSYTIDDRSYPWVPIVTPQGERGYVVEKFIRSPLDYRIGISKTETEEWEIYLFIAGD